MMQHRALLAMLTATYAAAQEGTAAAAQEGTPSPVNLTESRWVKVKTYSQTDLTCLGPPTKVDFLLLDACVPAELQQPFWQRVFLGPPDGEDGFGGNPLPGTAWTNSVFAVYETDSFSDDCSSAFWRRVKARSTCDGPFDGHEYRQATFDARVGTAFMQYFNTTDCSDEGGPFASSLFPIEHCMPVAVARNSGFLVGTDAARSVITWSYPDGLYGHTFVSEDCSGEEEAARVRGGRTGWAQGGVCTTFPDGEELSGAVSYKLWTHKRSARAAEPRCAWVPAREAEEKKMIKHPNPDSCDCKKAGCPVTDGNDEYGRNETVTP